MKCKALTNTTFCHNQFKFNNYFITELELLAIVYSVADSDLELGRRDGFVLLALPAFLPSAFFSFFALNRGGVEEGGEGSLDPSLVFHAIDQ